jgi:hypothetical protein
MHIRFAPRRLVLLALTLGLAFTLAACSKKARPLRDYPDGLDGFRQLATDWVAAAKDGDKAHVEKMAARMALPDPPAFFAETFGADAKDRLLAEYTEGAADFTKVSGGLLLKLVKDEGRNQFEVRRHTDPEDPDATGFQMLALRGMKQPVPLYTLRLSRPDGSKVFSLWSFVYVGGGYRIVGRLTKVDDKPRSSDLDMLMQLPTAEAKKILDGTE